MPIYVGWFFISPQTFVAAGILLTGIYSLYANWATDNGAAAASKTVMNTTPNNAELEAQINAAN